MVSEATHSHLDIDFGGAPDGQQAPAKTVMAGYAKARLERAEAQKKFLRQTPKAAAHLDDLVDAMICFDKVRAGRMWREADSGRLAKSYRDMFKGGDLSRLKSAPVASQVAGLHKLSLTTGDLARATKDLHHDHRSHIVDPRNTGWYYEKYFDYGGAGHVTLQTFERFNDPTLGGEVAGTLRNAEHEDHIYAVAETGRWFSYVVEKTGYINGICLGNLGFRDIKGNVIASTKPGTASAIQTIDGAVGIISGSDFLGRLYTQLDTAFYGGNGRDGHTPVNKHIADGPGGFVMNGDMRVEKGEAIKVMMGVRVKLLVTTEGPDATAASATRLYPTVFSASTLDVLPPTPSQA